MGKEIEKKYLITKIPNDLNVLNTKEIHQTYLAIGDEEVRIRKSTSDSKEQYVMTVKKGKGLIREEIEIEITRETYQQLLGNDIGKRKKPLLKTRSIVKIGDNHYDLDSYKNLLLQEIKTIEIEFGSEEEANSFIKPDWFGEEVTEDIRYKNQYLWKSIQ